MESNKALATIEDLKFDSKATLSNDQKRALVHIVEEEFSNKRTLYSRVMAEKKEQLLDEYRHKVGYERLRADIETAKARLDQAKEALEAVGLDEDGAIKIYQTYELKRIAPSARKGYERVKNLMAAVEEDSSGQTKKAKVIARLWLARTYAEACILLKDVLGNGLIPAIEKKELQ
ncbi:MAG: hypothetical protein PHI58_05990 [Candidatus Omnitrophica bacterium]|nr:hypothetical protein [Candidatus Omnitrophota bacterium]